jgi:hypothetical protein
VVVEIVEIDNEELWCPRRGREVPNVALKNQKYVIRKNWKNLRGNEKQWVKDSERKTTSENEVNERETFTR